MKKKLTDIKNSLGLVCLEKNVFIGLPSFPIKIPGLVRNTVWKFHKMYKFEKGIAIANH